MTRTRLTPSPGKTYLFPLLGADHAELTYVTPEEARAIATAVDRNTANNDGPVRLLFAGQDTPQEVSLAEASDLIRQGAPIDAFAAAKATEEGGLA